MKCVFTILIECSFLIFDISIWGEIMAPQNFSKFYRSQIRDFVITFLNIVLIASFLDIICVFTIVMEVSFSIFDFSIWGEIMGPKIFQNSIARKSEIGHNFPKYGLNCFIFRYNMCFHNSDGCFFFDFGFFNLGGNYGPQNFSKFYRSQI